MVIPDRVPRKLQQDQKLHLRHVEHLRKILNPLIIQNGNRSKSAVKVRPKASSLIGRQGFFSPQVDEAI